TRRAPSGLRPLLTRLPPVSGAHAVEGARARLRRPPRGRSTRKPQDARLRSGPLTRRAASTCRGSRAATPRLSRRAPAAVRREIPQGGPAASRRGCKGGGQTLSRVPQPPARRLLAG